MFALDDGYVAVCRRRLIWHRHYNVIRTLLRCEGESESNEKQPLRSFNILLERKDEKRICELRLHLDIIESLNSAAANRFAQSILHLKIF